MNWENSSYASDIWYEEVSKYDYNKPGLSANTAHFTQVVWKDTEKIGCGVAGGKYVVCRYYPSGNYKGRFENNVLPKAN